MRRPTLVAPASLALAESARKRMNSLTLRRRFWTDRTRDLHSLLDMRESYGLRMRQAFWKWLVHRAPAEFCKRIFRRLRALAEEQERRDAALRAHELGAERKAARKVQQEQEVPPAQLPEQVRLG